MIIKGYGDSTENIFDYTSADGNMFYKKIYQKSLDLLKSNDVSSANTLNRSIQSLYEYVKNNDKAFQSFSKLVLQDKKSGYISNVLEGFEKENLKVIVSPFDNNKKYIRIPSGALIINKKADTLDENDDFNDREISTDENVSVYINSPNVSVFEREIAKHFGIDLNEGSNLVNVDYEIKNSKIFYKYKITTLRKEIETKDINGQEYNFPKISEKTIDEKIRTTVNGVDVITGSEELNNTWQIVKSVNSKIIRGFKRKDNNYSLEELIPLPAETNKKYAYIFFNTNIGKTNEEYYSEDDTYYSHSGKFCLHLTDQEELQVITQNNTITYPLKKYGMPIYRITIADLPSSFNNLNANVDQVSTISYLKSIDRNLLELRKLDVNYKARFFNSIEALDNIELKNDTDNPNIIKIEGLKDAGNNVKDITLSIDTKVTNNGITTINNTLNVKKDEDNTYSWVLADDTAINALI